MNLDTYKSGVVDGIYVTLPSSSGKATIGLLDELAVLGLHRVRREYEFPDAVGMRPFARFVMTQIVLQGYALHGWEGASCREPFAKAARR